MRRLLCCFASAAVASGMLVALHAQTSLAPPTHNSEEWARIAPHLPNPSTASAEKLELTGDVLRARRFPDDALLFYTAAANHGITGRLLKKEGVAHLELRHDQVARLCFQQAVHLNKRDAEAWNNLGAADYTLGNVQRSLSEYKHAVKLNRDSAIYRSNLALAFFEDHNARKGRRELAAALAIDPDILQHNNIGGYNLQVLASSHYADICFEMARAAALRNETGEAIAWFTRAAERGYDVRSGLHQDPALQSYLQQPQIKRLLDNEDLRRRPQLAGTLTPALPPSNTH